MTGEQKTRIIELRNAGRTYAVIAEELGVSSSAIKSFISRENIKESTVESSPPMNVHGVTESAKLFGEGFCRQCGMDLQLRNGNQMKRFCSERCRQKWWRKHPGEITEKRSATVCAGCGTVFKNNGNHGRRYCSRECYMAHRFDETRRAVNE